jgi:hypothetical protein
LASVTVDLLLFDANRLGSEELDKALHDSVGTIRGGGGSGLGHVSLKPEGLRLKWKEVGGEWVLADLPPGRYVARITPRAVDQGPPCLLVPHEFEFEVASGERVEHTWHPEFGGSARLNLTGLESLKSARLIDAEGVEVTMGYGRDAGGGGYTMSSGMVGPGLYSLLGVLAPGTYQVSMTLEDGSSHGVPLLIEASKVVDVTVRPEDLR